MGGQLEPVYEQMCDPELYGCWWSEWSPVAPAYYVETRMCHRCTGFEVRVVEEGQP